MSNPPRRILITGASGCVGHYVVEELITGSNDQLIILLKNPEGLRADLAQHRNVEVIEANYGDLEPHREIIRSADAAVLIAASWGGPMVETVNVESPCTIARYLTDVPGRRVFYFSSASVLGAGGQLLEEADQLGSDYIRSKYRAVQALESFSDRLEITGLFPTLVMGGDDTHPRPHLDQLLREAAKRAGLIRFLRAEGKFHLIHARDIARVVRALLDSETASNPRRLVLGNPAMTVNQIIEEFCDCCDRKILFRIPLRGPLINSLTRFFRIQLSDWDRYCLLHPDQSYRDAVNPASFGVPVACPTLRSALEDAGIVPTSAHSPPPGN